MDAALAIGRIVLVIIFIFSGFGKFADLSGTAAYIASKGLPFPQLLAAGAGAGELICGLAIAIGWQTRLAADRPDRVHGGRGVLLSRLLEFAGRRRARANQMIHATKNLSIIGGLIVLAVAGAGRWSVDGRER